MVSPGKTNRDRDSINKRSQYAAIAVPEYGRINPVAQTVLLLTLEGTGYREVGILSGNEAIASIEFAELELVAGQIFEEGL